jgi:hypothetical protein
LGKASVHVFLDYGWNPVSILQRVLRLKSPTMRSQHKKENTRIAK